MRLRADASCCGWPDDADARYSQRAFASSSNGQWVERGGSAIIGPDSNYIVDPIYDREEFIVADLDLSLIDREAWILMCPATMLGRMSLPFPTQ